VSEFLPPVLETRPRCFRPYPEYKDSGIEWLGKIPTHWQVKRLKNVASINPSKSEIGPIPTSLQVSFVPMEAVGEFGGLNLTSSREVGEVASGYTYFRDGDVLVAKITPCFENGKGALARGLENGIGFGTTELHVLRPTRQLVAEFLAYLTFADAFRRLGQTEMKGAAGQQRVPDDFVKHFSAPVPSLSEQRMIADFLNRETAKIDALVAEKQRAIELLQEKRAALITQTVTKGLSHNVPMRDSGIAWLGAIPKHWEVRPLKRVSPALTVGVVVNPSTYISDDGIPFLYGSDIKEGRIIPENARRMEPQQSAALSKSRLHAGDLVMVRVGAPGVTAVVPPELEGANCASILIIRGSKSFDSQWLCYVLNSRVVRYQVEIVQYGAAQEQFNVSHAAEFLVPCPPATEQHAIAAALEQHTAEIDGLIGTVHRGIDRLSEFRTALISAAVTGKIDVREESA
jgi:type I restriction enzyme S subunit